MELRKKEPKPVVVTHKRMEEWVGHILDWVVFIQILDEYKAIGDWDVELIGGSNGDGITIS